MNQKRIQLIVYTRKINIQQKMAQFGHVIYTSRKMNYVCLYVSEGQKDSVVSRIKKLHGVQKVEVGLPAINLANEKIEGVK
jgi:uncharacterized protein YlbG (UPF0298 family)